MRQCEVMRAVNGHARAATLGTLGHGHEDIQYKTQGRKFEISFDRHSRSTRFKTIRNNTAVHIYSPNLASPVVFGVHPFPAAKQRPSVGGTPSLPLASIVA